MFTQLALSFISQKIPQIQTADVLTPGYLILLRIIHAPPPHFIAIIHVIDYLRPGKSGWRRVKTHKTLF